MKINPFKKRSFFEYDLKESLRPLIGDDGVKLMEELVDLPEAQKEEEFDIGASFESQEKEIDEIYKWICGLLKPEWRKNIHRYKSFALEEGGVVIKASLELANTGLQSIPKNLYRINGNFILSDNKLVHLTNFPKFVTGDVSLNNNPLLGVKGLEGVQIGGNLILSNTYLTRFPESATVNGKIWVTNTKRTGTDEFKKIQKSRSKLVKILFEQKRRVKTTNLS